jgi:hypothetical protein
MRRILSEEIAMNFKTFTSNRHSAYFLVAMVFAFTGLQSQAEAALTVFSDKATFFAETGATSATGPLPLLGYVSSAKLGSMTISNTSGLAFGIVGSPNPADSLTPLLPGIDLAVDGFEDINITSDTTIFSFGFDFAEHMAIPSEEGSLCGVGFSSGCVDSVFMVSLLLGSSPVSSFSFNAPNDVASFVGASSTEAFNRVEIRESRTQGGVENDYFGQFYTGSNQNSIPEPSAMFMFGSGLIGLIGAKWKKFMVAG